MFNRIITTAEKYESNKLTDGGLIDGAHLEGTPKEYQTVVKVGSSVREVQPGDVIVIDPTRYIRRTYDKNSIQNDLDNNPIVSVNIPVVEMDGKDYFMIDDRDILYVIKDYEEIEETPAQTIIKPKTPKIIV